MDRMPELDREKQDHVYSFVLMQVVVYPCHGLLLLPVFKAINAEDRNRLSLQVGVSNSEPIYLGLA